MTNSKSPAYFWSPNSNGFWPADRPDRPDHFNVPITAARHATLMRAQASGAQIQNDQDSKPVAVAARPGIAQVRGQAVRRIRNEAARRIDATVPVWRQVNALRNGTDPGWSRIDAIRAASNLIEEDVAALKSADAIATVDIANHPLWPEFD
jgi:hypothetical protein